MARKKEDFATRMQRLEQIVEALEREDAPLEQSMELYKEGVSLVRQCREQLEKARYDVTLRGADGPAPLVPDDKYLQEQGGE